jgi:hypothetical protein
MIAVLRETANHVHFVRDVLGDDLVLPEQIIGMGGVEYTTEQIARLDNVLRLNPLIPQYCHENGMILVPGPPCAISLLVVRAVCPTSFSRNDVWYLNKNFAKEEMVEPGWIALRKEPFLDSFNKSWSEQIRQIPPSALVPNIAVLSWCLAVFEAVHHVSLLSDLFVRSSSVGMRGIRLGIGRSGKGCLVVSRYSTFLRSPSMGLVTYRSFRTSSN